MASALIGYTGFVGGNLREQSAFEGLFNSRNIETLRGRAYDLVVCAGAPAVKWKANKDPEGDRACLEGLADVLGTVDAGRMVLISTVDVYPVLSGVDETFDCHAQENHAYGRNRLWLEDVCRDRFDACQVIRLPALFGRGLKKNVIFDLLNDNCLDVINPSSSFQYYCLDHLWRDVSAAIEAGPGVVNFMTEPIATSEILDRHFAGKHVGQNAAPEYHYDVRTAHGSLRGRTDGYLYGRDEVLEDLARFIEAERGAA